MTIELAQPVSAAPWQPMSNPTDLKHLGKLAEELSELGQVVARCIIQGIDEVEPVTGKSNRLWLEEEFADVSANMLLVARRWNLRDDFMYERMDKKVTGLNTWHGL